MTNKYYRWFEWFLGKCFLVVFVVISVSLFIVIAKTEIAKEDKMLDKSIERLERAKERRIESIIGEQK